MVITTLGPYLSHMSGVARRVIMLTADIAVTRLAATTSETPSLTASGIMYIRIMACSKQPRKCMELRFQ